MTVDLEAVDGRIGPDEVENDVELGLGHWVEVDAATGKAYLRQTNLVEVDRQQLGGAGLVIIVSLVKLHRQQPYFKIVATVERTVAHDRAAPFQQTGKQTRALDRKSVV